MRTLLCGIVAGLVFSQVPGPGSQVPSPGSAFTGRVIVGSGADTKPVRRAKVTVTGGRLTAPVVTDTDAKGVYTIPKLAGATYKVKVQKPGYVTLDADAGANATLTLQRGAAIEGIVSDAATDPVWGVIVSAYQPQPDGAKPKLVATTRTDDLGHYRLHSLEAGDYLVEAATDRQSMLRTLLIAGEKYPEVNRAFYPAAGTVEEAKPVHVNAGRDATAIDLTLNPGAPVIDAAAPPRPPRPDANGTGRIAGTVTDAASGKPIRGAQLLLLLAPGQGPALTNWARTDKQGRYEYTSLEAKRFTLSVRDARHVSLEYGQKRPGETGTQIELKEGEDFRADVKLPRTSALDGTVLDEFGDPAPGVTIQLAQRLYAAGRQRLMPFGNPGNSAPSDDRGHFRVAGLAPGDYYMAGLSGVYTDANEAGGFAPTYYPGTADSGGAMPITVALGADAVGTTLAMVPAKTFTVAGTMTDQTGTPVSGRGTIWLATPDHLKRADFNLARGVTAADGSFVLRNVPQGTYTLQGFAPPPSADYRGPGNLAAFPFGWLPVTVGDAHVDGLVLKTTAGTTLRGRIVFENMVAAPLPLPDRVSIQTFPIEFDSAPVGGGPSPSETRPDWTFEVTRQSGIRRIAASAGPNWALKKITVNDLDVTDETVDLRTKDVENVHIVFTPKVTHLSGGVSDDKGPVADYALVIFPSDPTKWYDRSRFITTARPTQQGRYTVVGLPPESYLAIALPGITGFEQWDPDFLQQLRINATAFVLAEGESKTLDLKLKKRP